MKYQIFFLFIIFLILKNIFRYDNLKKKYFKLKRNQRSGDAPITWRYFNTFEQLFHQSPLIHPVNELDSMAGNSNEMFNVTGDADILPSTSGVAPVRRTR